MDNIKWAENEVELAKKQEKSTSPKKDWDYGCACYDSALKALKCLAEDEHSGASIQFTKHILDRLIDLKPLTPIEDEPGIWSKTEVTVNVSERFQCKRMSSLFKTVFEDGTAVYHDNNRVLCYDRDIETGEESGIPFLL